MFIDHIRAKDKSTTTLYSIPANTIKFTTSVTYYELLMGATSQQKVEDIKLLLANIVIIPFDQEAAIKASEIFHLLKATNKLIEFRDIFIAAICITNSLPVLTLNKKHFLRIEELKML